MITFKQFLTEAPDKNIPSRSHADAVMAKRVAEEISELMMAHWYNPMESPWEWFGDSADGLEIQEWIADFAQHDSVGEKRLKQAVLAHLQKKLA